MNGFSAAARDAQGVRACSHACTRVCMRILLVAAALAAVEDAFLPAPATPATLCTGPRPLRVPCQIRLRGGTDAGSIPSGDEEKEEKEDDEDEASSIHIVDSADALDAVSLLADWDDKCVMSSANLFSVLCCTVREKH